MNNKTTLDIDEMNIDQLREVVKIQSQLMSYEHDRLTILQDRVTKLERKFRQLDLMKPGDDA